MNTLNRQRVSGAMDFVFSSCRFDSAGKVRPTEERIQNYARYIGWLEGHILECFTDEQAERLLNRINIGFFDYADDETVRDNNENGSFY